MPILAFLSFLRAFGGFLTYVRLRTKSLLWQEPATGAIVMGQRHRPTPVQKSLRRPYRGPGGGGGSVADSGGSCKEEFGSTCKGLPADNEYEGKQYCVLHFPSVDKDLAAFEEAIEEKLKNKDFDFRGIYVPPNASSFSNATFEGGTYLDNAIFKEVGKFWSLRTFSQTFLSFRAAVIEKPERLSFHSTVLRPSWFIDVDAQKFDFSDVEWFRLPDGDELELEKEIEALDGGSGKVPTPSSLRKLQKACRKLMDNAEENRDYATANEFHYWSMELLRKEGWRELGLIGTL